MFWGYLGNEVQHLFEVLVLETEVQYEIQAQVMRSICF